MFVITSQLMLLAEILTVYSEKCMEHMRCSVWLKYRFLKVRVGRIYSITNLDRPFGVMTIRIL